MTGETTKKRMAQVRLVGQIVAADMYKEKFRATALDTENHDMTALSDALLKTGITSDSFKETKDIDCSFSYTASGITVWLPNELLPMFVEFGGFLDLSPAGTELFLKASHVARKMGDGTRVPTDVGDSHFRMGFDNKTGFNGEMFSRSGAKGFMSMRSGEPVLVINEPPHKRAYTPYTQPSYAAKKEEGALAAVELPPEPVTDYEVGHALDIVNRYLAQQGGQAQMIDRAPEADSRVQKFVISVVKVIGG